MKRFKLNLAMLAMLVAVTAAFAFKPARPAHVTSQQYGRIALTGADQWVLADDDSFHCDASSSSVCKANFNGDPDNGGTLDTTVPSEGTGIYVAN